jgi:GH24 family phage-related lysozyme (muramidase)
MTNATVRSAAEHIARTGKITPQQLAAFSGLDEGLTTEQRQAFTDLWRAEGSPAAKQSDLAAALKLIKEFEGCHLEAYADPLHGWDVATIGFGTTRYGNGRKVQQGDKINAIEADMLLRQEVDRIAEKLRATVPFWVAMADHQKCALISFAYNLGSGFYGVAGFETISRELREKNWTAVPAALLLYRNPGTNVEAGLKRRREAEGKLWAGNQQQQQPPAKLSPASAFTARMTPHITIGEFALNQEDRRFNHQFQVDTAAELAAFLERVRSAFGGKPVIITSGYRSAIINRSVGGASGSEHLYNAPGIGAVDFYIQGADITAVQAWCDKEWPCSVGYGAPKGFVHLGIRAGRPRVRWDY